jgi:hypothetical protein
MRPLALAVLLFASVAGAQQPLAARQRPSSMTVFLDCSNFSCDEDYVRTEITYVNWVRDRTAADVHVLGTSQQTGGGGREYTIAFIGLRDFNGMSDTVRYVAGATETDDERRKGIVKVLRTGLVRYLARTTIADRLQISVTGGSDAAPAQTQHDPWNSWVFRISTFTNANGDANSKFMYLNGNVDARRLTQQWKHRFSANENYNQQTFTIDGEKSTFIRRNYQFDQLSVKSIGPKAAAGLKSEIGQSTRDNKQLYYQLMPAFEYDIFPYSESTRRMLTLQYAAGIEGFRYDGVTIYGKLREAHPLHSLHVGLLQNQPWGSVDIGVEGGQYLDMTNKNYAEIGGNINIRVFKGFSIEGGGEYSAIRNQLYLPASGATPEEILLQQRQLATGYQYFMFMGISYTFGSVLNNIVNPRFGR